MREKCQSRALEMPLGHVLVPSVCVLPSPFYFTLFSFFYWMRALLENLSTLISGGRKKEQTQMGWGFCFCSRFWFLILWAGSTRRPNCPLVRPLVPSAATCWLSLSPVLGAICLTKWSTYAGAHKSWPKKNSWEMCSTVNKFSEELAASGDC